MREASDVGSANASARVVRICTDNWPEPDRVAMFHEVHGRDNVRVEPRPNEPLRIDAVMVRFPNLGLLRGWRSPLRSAFSDGNDRLMLNLGGPAFATQFGREVRLEAGDAIALSGADGGTLTTMQAGRIATLEFPLGALLPLLKDPRKGCAHRIPQHSSALRLLRGYTSAAHASAWTTAAPGLPQMAIAHIHDLAAMAVGAGREAEEIARGRGVRAARLRAIKHDILAQIEQELSLTDVAARHRLSPRYVRMLFESEGTSMTEFVRDERLRRARAMLLSPRFATRRIGEIAYQVGFNDLSYFNRSFRRRFGYSPSEVREMARAATPSEREIRKPLP